MARSLVTKKADIFSRELGSFYGDMYATAVDIYPSFCLMGEISIRFTNDDAFDAFSAFVDPREGPGITMGRRLKGLGPRMESRLMERFQLPEVIIRLPEADRDGVLRPIVLAHELGHIAQADSSFLKYFGKIIDKVGVDPRTDYPTYVSSDAEVNADYIAATILANSKLGEVFGYEMPAQEPMAWREWGACHPVDQTIARYAGDSVAV
ncbi:MAG: hypothetical protein WBP26_06180 [Candidatus Saccharimonadales bacterium]